MRDDIDLTKIWGQVYANGGLMEAGEAVVSALDRGFLHGDGVFETIRVYKGKPFMLDAHLERMADGCSVIRISPPDSEEIRRGVKLALEKNGLSDAYLRITVTRGASGRLWYDLDHSTPTVVIITKPLVPKDFGEGLRLMVSAFRSDEESPLSRIKQTGILWKILARAEAKESGVDDAVLLNTKGRVAEATSANMFWTRNKALYTPAIHCGLLPGITRRIVIETARANGLAVREGAFALDELKGAEEVFLTSSTWEIAPAKSLDGVLFPGGSPGPITRRLADLYRQKVRETLNLEP